MSEYDPRTGVRSLEQATGVRTPVTPIQQPTEFKRGLRSGLTQLSAISSGVAGAGRALAGDEAGADAATQEAEQFQQEASRFGPTVSNISDVDSIDEFGKWAAGMVGQQLPVMGTMVGGGPVALGVRGAVKAALPGAARAALPSATKTAAGGMIAGASAMEAGSIFPEINKDPIARANMTGRERALTALGFGTAAGSLEALPFIGIAKRFGVDKAATQAVKKSLAEHVAKGALTQGAIESGTEAAQTVVERAALKFANENRDIFTDEGINEIMNASAAGLLLGGGIGGIGGGLGFAASRAGDVRDSFAESFEDMEAVEQLAGAKVQSGLSKMRQAFANRPELVSEIDDILASDLQNPDIRDEAIKFSKTLHDIVSVEDVLRERGYLSEDQNQDIISQQRNDVLTISELARDPDQIDVGIIEELDKRYTGTAGDIFDIIEDVRTRMFNIDDTQGVAEAETKEVGFDEDTGDADVGAALDVDVERMPKYVADVDYRKGEDATKISADNVLTSAQADDQMDNLVDNETGIALKGRGASEVASGDTVYTKVPLSEAVIGNASVTMSGGMNVSGKPAVLRAQGGKYSPEQLYKVAARKMAATMSNKKLSAALGQEAYEPNAVADLKALASTDPKAFLDHFYAIKKQAMTKTTAPIVEASPADATGTLSATDVSPTTSKQVRKSIVRHASVRAGEQRTATEVPLVKVSIGEDGKPVRDAKQPNTVVNLAALTSTMLSKLARGNKNLGTPNVKNVARAFREGLTSLIADHGLIPSKIDSLPRETVVFYTAGTTKPDITLGDVIDYMAASTAEKNKADIRRPSAPEVATKSRKQAILLEDALNELFVSTVEEQSESDVSTLTFADIGRDEIQEMIDIALRRQVEAAVAKRGQVFGRTIREASKKSGQPIAKIVEGARARSAAKIAPIKARIKEERAKIHPPKKTKAPTPTHPESVQAALDKWAAQFQILKMRLLSSSAAVDVARRAGRPELITTDGTQIRPYVHGFISAEGIYIDSTMSEAAQLEALAHELGHLIFMKYVDQAAKSLKINKAVVDAFDKWMKEHVNDKHVADVLKDKSPLHLMARGLEIGGNRELSSLSAEELQYLFDFQEWFADNTAKFLADETIVPKNAVERLFKTISKMIRKLMEGFIAAPDAAVSDLLRSITTTVQGKALTQAQENIQKDVERNLTGIRMSKNTRGKVSEGTVVGADLVTKDPYSAQARTALAHWVQKNMTAEELRVLLNAFSNAGARKKIEELIGTMGVQPMTAIATGIQLWNAGAITVGPKSTTVLGKFTKWLSDYFGILTTEDKAKLIKQALMKGRISSRVEERTFHLKEIYRQNLRARVANATLEHAKRMTGPIVAYTYTADSRMQTHPALREIAEKFHARVGQEVGVPQTYFEARRTHISNFSVNLEEILHGVDKESQARILQDAQLGYPHTGLSEQEIKVSNNVRKLFNAMFKYAESRGVSTTVTNVDHNGKPIKEQQLIRRRQNYFPVVYDINYMRENSDKFIAMLSQPKYARFFKGEGSSPTQLYTHIFQNLGYGDTKLASDSTENIGLTPAMSAVNSRVLGWVDPADLEPFLNKSLEYTVIQYIESIVKRAEYTARFGSNGETLKQLLAAAKAGGATEAELEVAHNYIEAMLGTIGRETNRKLFGLFNMTPPPGQVINPTLQKAMSAIIVFRNLAVLGMASFTSIADIAGIAVRSGSIEDTWTGYKSAIGEMRNGIKNIGAVDGVEARSELNELAEMLGIIDTHMTNEALEYEFGGSYMSPGLKKINEAFFNMIGLTQLTRLVRVMALASAKSFIMKHDKNFNKHSKRFMQELGLQKGDIKYTGRGDTRDIDILSRPQRRALEDAVHAGGEEAAAAAKAELARDDRVRAALSRWVDGAILRPNAAQRPVWASDPHYMLFFHLKSFMYTFHDRILRRAYTEMATHGNYHAAMGLMLYVPLMMAIDAARDWMKYGFSGAPRKANWTFMDYTESAIDRAGMYGVGGQMIMDAGTDRGFGGTGLESHLGALTYPTQLMSGVLTGDSGKIEKSLPLQSIWRNW